MAIKRKTPDAEPLPMPPEFSEHVRRAFTLQYMAQTHKAGYDDERAWLVNYLETNEDGIEVTVSQAFKVAEGALTMKQRTDYEIDTEALAKMVAKGEISLDTILNIASINAGKLKACIGEKRFGEIATAKTGEHLELKANPDFKAEMERVVKIDRIVGGGAPIITSSPDPVSKPAVEPEAPKGKRGNRALPKVPPTAVESDLDAILNGKG